MELVALGFLCSLITAVIVGDRLSKSRAFESAQKRLQSGPHRFVDGEIVTLVGTVKAVSTILAPISDRTCVAWHVKAIMGPHWLTHMEMVEFVLETEYGDVVVEHQALIGFALPHKRLRPRYEVSKRFLVAMGRSTRDASVAMFEEVVVEPGQKVSIYGVVRCELELPSTAREMGFREANQVIRLRGMPKNQLAIGKP